MEGKARNRVPGMPKGFPTGNEEPSFQDSAVPASTTGKGGAVQAFPPPHLPFPAGVNGVRALLKPQPPGLSIMPATSGELSTANATLFGAPPCLLQDGGSQT